ncbi:MAG TPA: very short patch repair endonuclease [Rikenellaceae bacterium]|nr:very short patch repair endonuclease [Rikenellaceae bacterium]
MDTISKDRRSWNMSQIKGKNTKPEILVRSSLHKMGYRFRLHDKNLPGTPDIVLPKYKTVILIHGCFWHRHRDCKFSYNPKSHTDFWFKKFNDTIDRDKNNYRLLLNEGWLPLVLWECEIKASLESVLIKIETFLNNRIK